MHYFRNVLHFITIEYQFKKFESLYMAKSDLSKPDSKVILLFNYLCLIPPNLCVFLSYKYYKSKALHNDVIYQYTLKTIYNVTNDINAIWSIEKVIMDLYKKCNPYTVEK